MAAKRDIIISLELLQGRRNLNAKFGIFNDGTGQKMSQTIATTIEYQKLQDWHLKRLYCHLRFSDIVTITWRHFVQTRHGRHT